MAEYRYTKEKKALVARLESEGRLKEYQAWRDRIKKPPYDIDEHLAWKVAGIVFKPLDGGVSEIPMNPDFMRAIDKLGVNLNVDRPELSINLLGDDEISTPAEPTAAAPQRGGQTEWNMLSAAVKPRKTIPVIAMLDFVLEHQGIPPSQINPEDVPCHAAVSLLRMYQTDAAFIGFVERVYQRRIPDKKEIERQEKRGQGTEMQLGILEAFEKEQENFINGEKKHAETDEQ